MPYISLSILAHVKATCGKDKVVLNLSGSFLDKLLDQYNERSISVVDWHTASHVMEERTCFHHSDAWAEALAMHHKVIMNLGFTHSWEIAIEYDIQQHKLSSLNPTHDLSSLNTTVLTIIATCALIHSAVTHPHLPIETTGDL